MTATAKVFEIEGEQAVRLPAGFRFFSKEVLVRCDDETGEIVLSGPGTNADEESRPKPDRDKIFAALDAANIPDDLWRPEDRDRTPPPDRPIL